MFGGNLKARARFQRTRYPERIFRSFAKNARSSCLGLASWAAKRIRHVARLVGRQHRVNGRFGSKLQRFFSPDHHGRLEEGSTWPSFVSTRLTLESRDISNGASD